MIIVLLGPIAGAKILEMVLYLIVQCLKLMFLFLLKDSLLVLSCVQF